MSEHPEQPDPERDDERASIPPEEDDTETEGPRGNPEVDEEALRHGQQDGDD